MTGKGTRTVRCVGRFDMENSILIKESAIDSLLSHALRSAKAHGKEVLGWLLGFFQEDGVCVSESIPCTKYVFQSRFGAEADPTQEAEVASSYPRNIGIVGLYHSHPFAVRLEGGHFRRISTLDDIFHSRIDDRTLRSRASRRKNYLSIVTNGIDFSCYVMKKKSRKVEPTLVREIPYRSSLESYHSDFATEIEERIMSVDVNDIIAGCTRALMDGARKKLRREELTVERGAFHGGSARPRKRSTEPTQENILSITKEGKFALSTAHISLTSSIYTKNADEKEVLRAMKEEILDNIAYLLWKLSTSKFSLRRSWNSIKIHLGNIGIDESGSLPRRQFRVPDRGITIKQS